MTDTMDEGEIIGLSVEIADLRRRAKQARRVAQRVEEGAADGIREHALALEAKLQDLENALVTGCGNLAGFGANS